MCNFFRTKALLLVAGLFLSLGHSYAQDLNAITTSVPFLLISPDARGGAMGETGAASDPDVSSLHWNPSKLAFAEKSIGIEISYLPWLRELVDDIGMYNVGGYYKPDKNQAIGFGLRYFSLGSIMFTNSTGQNIGEYKPNEFSLEAGYSRKLTDNLSGGVTGRFIYSNLTLGQQVGSAASHAGTSFAADVSMYYRTPLEIRDFRKSSLAFGMNISNIGAKIAYTSTIRKDFIPTNLRLGTSFSFDIDDYNSMSFNIDFTKLLVPSPPIYIADSFDVNGNRVIAQGKDPDVSVVKGIFQSFYDAPGGFSEELKEVTWAVGAEYWYNKQFALRAGYFHESEMKGNRKFITMGAGLKYNVFGLDFAYLVSTDQRSPLDNTLRFTLTFDFAAFSGQ